MLNREIEPLQAMLDQLAETLPSTHKGHDVIQQIWSGLDRIMHGKLFAHTAVSMKFESRKMPREERDRARHLTIASMGGFPAKRFAPAQETELFRAKIVNVVYIPEADKTVAMLEDGCIDHLTGMGCALGIVDERPYNHPVVSLGKGDLRDQYMYLIDTYMRSTRNFFTVGFGLEKEGV